MLCPEFLEPKVGETVDMVEDPQHRQGLHCIQVKLREADVQVQQGLPEERGKRQLEPLEEVVPCTRPRDRGWSSWLIGWVEDSKLHIIRDLIKFPD